MRVGAELDITRQTLYRHVDPKGQLRLDGENHSGARHAVPTGPGCGESRRDGPFCPSNDFIRCA